MLPLNDAASLVDRFAALTTQPAPQAACKAHSRPLPAYVINMPVKVDSDDEGSSSDEEDDRRFPKKAFEKPSRYFRLLPNESKNTSRGELLEIKISSSPNPQLLPSKATASVIKLCEREAVSLQKGQPSSIHRLAMCIGFNKMRSLSTRRNNALNRCLKASYEGNIPIGKIAFLWEGVWERKSSDGWTKATYKDVHAFYKQLKRRDLHKAEKFRAEIERLRSHLVPFREIRDAIKNHEETKRLIKHMRDQDKSRDIYITFMDSDIKSFHHRPGAPSPFAVFDENYLQYPFEICSTGYTISEPNNPILELGVLADMTVRDATARHIKRGAYYPEPCTAVKVPVRSKTIPEQFGDPKKTKYSAPQEMPRLIAEILQRRELSAQDAMRFDMRGAIITTTPPRMQREFRSRKVPQIGVILWSLPDFKTMRDINQSHFNSRDWARNLIPALRIQPLIKIPSTTSSLEDKKVLRNAVISLLSRLFNACDPIQIALKKSIREGSFHTSLIQIVNNFQVDTKIEKVTQRKAAKIKDKEKRKTVNSLWKWIDSIDTVQGLTQALKTLLDQKGSSIKVESILQAARECGQKLADLFRSTLCLNYPDLVVDALSDLLEVDYATIHANLPSLYRSIMEGYTVEGSIQTTRQEIKELPDYYGVTPLHLAALAGNVKFASWLLSDSKNPEGLCENQDKNRLNPLDYGLQQCKNNGINLKLLSALWEHMDVKALKYFSQKVVNELNDNSDRLAVLDKLLQDKKNTKIIHIQNPDLELLVCAVIDGFEELAECLFKCGNYPKELCEATDDDSKLFIIAVRLGFANLAKKLAEYNDYESDVLTAMIDEAPKINENLLEWAEVFDIVDDIRPHLDDDELSKFNSNLALLRGVAEETSEGNAHDSEEPLTDSSEEAPADIESEESVEESTDNTFSDEHRNKIMLLRQRLAQKLNNGNAP